MMPPRASIVERVTPFHGQRPLADCQSTPGMGMLGNLAGEPTMSEEKALLAANEAFYQAFSARDLEAMKAVWAQRAPTACIHPGWGPLVERDKVIESWAEILSGPNSPRITCHGARAFQFGDSAFVICFEAVQGAYLIATNVFVKEDGAWRLVHHQAGPTNEVPEETTPPPRSTKKTLH